MAKRQERAQLIRIPLAATPPYPCPTPARPCPPARRNPTFQMQAMIPGRLLSHDGTTFISVLVPLHRHLKTQGQKAQIMVPMAEPVAGEKTWAISIQNSASKKQSEHGRRGLDLGGREEAALVYTIGEHLVAAPQFGAWVNNLMLLDTAAKATTLTDRLVAALPAVHYSSIKADGKYGWALFSHSWEVDVEAIRALSRKAYLYGISPLPAQEMQPFRGQTSMPTAEQFDAFMAAINSMVLPSKVHVRPGAFTLRPNPCDFRTANWKAAEDDGTAEDSGENTASASATAAAVALDPAALAPTSLAPAALAPAATALADLTPVTMPIASHISLFKDHNAAVPSVSRALATGAGGGGGMDERPHETAAALAPVPPANSIDWENNDNVRDAIEGLDSLHRGDEASSGGATDAPGPSKRARHV